VNQQPISRAGDFCLWYLEKQIPETIASADNIAAVLIEPGLAEGGNWIPTKEFIQGLRGVCDRNDWLLISDEVLTGVGRTGKMWAIEHYDVVPDILIYGKNLSGGVAPLAGISARDDILGDNTHFKKFMSETGSSQRPKISVRLPRALCLAGRSTPSLGK